MSGSFIAGRRHLGKVLAAGAAFLAIALAAVWTWPGRQEAPPPVARLAIQPKSPLGTLYLPALAISHDASRLALVVRDAETGGTRLVVRHLDGLDEVPLPGTEGGHAPFFSPDGRSIGFFAAGELRALAVDGGGEAVTLAEVGVPRGADWGADGWIYFARGSGGGLWRVPAGGGAPEPFTELEPGEWSHRWPHVSPDGETLIFVVGDGGVRSNFDEAAIAALSLATGDRQVLTRGGSFPRFAAGRLHYVREGRILSTDFDRRRLVLGLPRTALEGVSWYPINGSAQVAIAADGSLAYLPGTAPWQPIRRLLWVDREGVTEPAGEPSAETGRLFYDPALSPDGRKLAVAVAEGGNSDLWIYDLERRTRSRLTDSPGEDQGPVWHPDGRTIAYYSSRAGPFRMYLTDVSGAAEPRQLPVTLGSQRPECFSSDGRWLIFSQVHPATGFNLWYLDLESATEPQWFLATEYDELQARLSPAGDWLAYVSNESGRREVYLRRATPDDPSRWPLSAGGGEDPIWDPRGDAVYYRTPGAVVRVAVTGSAAGEPEIGTPEPWLDWSFPPTLLEGRHRRAYAIDPDGSRFLVLEALQQTAPPVRVVLHWAAEPK